MLLLLDLTIITIICAIITIIIISVKRFVFIYVVNVICFFVILLFSNVVMMFIYGWIIFSEEDYCTCLGERPARAAAARPRVPPARCGGPRCTRNIFVQLLEVGARYDSSTSTKTFAKSGSILSVDLLLPLRVCMRYVSRPPV